MIPPREWCDACKAVMPTTARGNCCDCEACREAPRREPRERDAVPVGEPSKLGMTVAELRRAFDRRFDAVIASLSISQLLVYRAFYDVPTASRADVARELTCSPSAVTQAIAAIARKFEAAGLPTPLHPRDRAGGKIVLNTLKRRNPAA